MLGSTHLNKIRKLINDTDYSYAIALKALSEVNRFRIFTILTEYSKLSVNDIATVLQISTPLASVHLKVMQEAKLILKNKSGQKVHLQLDLKNKFVRSFIKVMIVSGK
jgi:DNA-binding transcriptional ArsR family regulator